MLHGEDKLFFNSKSPFQSSEAEIKSAHDGKKLCSPAATASNIFSWSANFALWDVCDIWIDFVIILGEDLPVAEGSNRITETREIFSFYSFC